MGEQNSSKGKGQKFFVRESSGLIREISATDAFSMNFSYLGPAGGVAYPLTFAPLLIGASWLLAGIVGAVMMFPVLMMYYFLSKLIPRSAGDYIYISRALGPKWGFLQALSNIFAFATGNPIVAQLELPLAVQPSLEILGVYFHDPALITIANDFSFSNETGLPFVAGTIVILTISFLVSIARTKYFARIITALTIVQILGTAAMIGGLLLVAGRYSQVFNSVSTQFGGPTYQSLSSMATVSPHINIVTTMVLASVLVAFLYAYNNAPTYFGGEVKSAKRSMFSGLVISYIIIAFISVILIALLQLVVGEGFYNYTSINGWDSPNGVGIPIATTSLLSYVALPFLKNLPILILMIASAFTWYVLYSIIQTSIPSRTLFAISFDWLAPTIFSKVSEKLRTPIIAISTIYILAVFFDIMEIYFGLTISAITSTIIYLMYQYFTASLAAVKMGKNSQFGAGKELVRYGILSALMIAITVAFLVGYGVVAYSTFGSAIFPTNLILNIGIIVGMPIVSIVAYEVIRRIRLKQGIDLEMTFKEVPPE
ncbi:APC family permease [Sulfuracidifex metallicus]|uniref:Amino acid permease n=2 Tax=Sulfuracidifex metallicus TaxID=47303 RepID=A0A6A9QMT1_SULME|nr:amino acid permease [Sulfuracidifex metallicus]MUN29038.1 amino acid permease [Sulfuracidifex metallicus DSM 6482 = JCM 9184]WOE50451.1 amino acid permease [Sulfuracidifex metallicus DSM 6482 = JCM 9184]